MVKCTIYSCSEYNTSKEYTNVFLKVSEKSRILINRRYMKLQSLLLQMQ